MSTTRSRKPAADASHDRLQTILDTTTDGVLIVDSAGIVKYANHAAATILGREPSALLGHNMGLPGASARDVEITVARGNSVGFAELRGAPIDWDGEDSMLIALRDVTERHLAEAENERGRQQIALQAAALAASASAVFICTPDGDIEWVNRAFETLTGFDRTSAIGRKPSILKSGHHDQAHYQHLWETIKSGQVWRSVTTNRAADGRLLTVEQTITPIPDASGGIGHFVAVQNDISERLRYEERLHDLAFRDELCQLPNRRAFVKRAEEALDAARRHDDGLAVAVFDIDRFKAVNDALGHLAGDALLQHLGGVLSATLRSTDMLARIGGDEFVMLFDRITDTHDLQRAVQRVRDTLEAPLDAAGHEVRMTISMGVALYPQDGRDCTTLISHADAAMYAAKEAGRNTVRYFSTEMDTGIARRLSIESAIAGALGRGELRLVYQPRFRLADAALSGCEALLRWHHPKLGDVSPAEFIPIAEQCAEIVRIGAWVIAEVGERAARWRAAGLLRTPIALNLSAVQFRAGNVASVLREQSARLGLPAGALEVEITETVMLDAAEQTLAQLHELGRCGFPLSLDDFGVGYSSMLYLQRLPVATLKIDKSFVDTVASQEPGAQAIVRAITSLGHDLGLSVIAEGVETDQQRAALIACGCDEGQGYLFSRPLEEADFERLLRDCNGEDGHP